MITIEDAPRALRLQLHDEEMIGRQIKLDSSKWQQAAHGLYTRCCEYITVEKMFITNAKRGVATIADWSKLRRVAKGFAGEVRQLLTRELSARRQRCLYRKQLCLPGGGAGYANTQRNRLNSGTQPCHQSETVAAIDLNVLKLRAKYWRLTLEPSGRC